MSQKKSAENQLTDIISDWAFVEIGKRGSRVPKWLGRRSPVLSTIANDNWAWLRAVEGFWDVSDVLVKHYIKIAGLESAEFWALQNFETTARELIEKGQGPVHEQHREEIDAQDIADAANESLRALSTRWAV